jgi:putative endonuclease
MHERIYFTYILASRLGGTLYIGMTNDLMRRMFEHRSGTGSKFTSDHSVYALVQFEQHATAGSAILREKQLKRWKRSWKVRLIEETNPNWDDLTLQLSP